MKFYGQLRALRILTLSVLRSSTNSVASGKWYGHQSHFRYGRSMEAERVARIPKSPVRAGVDSSLRWKSESVHDCNFCWVGYWGFVKLAPCWSCRTGDLHAGFALVATPWFSPWDMFDPVFFTVFVIFVVEMKPAPWFIALFAIAIFNLQAQCSLLCG